MDRLIFIAFLEAYELSVFFGFPFAEHKRRERDKSWSGKGGMGKDTGDRNKKTPAVFKKQRAGRGHVIDIG
ncbi:hypothetical protein [Bacillus paralicheniformis]|uniref:hypothetical protein n=1 Tax=Bacillus paralicheniformis TaxID=1648923 RepID=UPI002DBD7D35|nr:hypothetical protein [Bacillus paralicheniformis]MEC1288441.1 hypothetical protein [Bacillus paralicheniformis]